MEGDIVWARVPGITVPWPARLERESGQNFRVFCYSDDALVTTKKIFSFGDFEEMSARAKHALKKKPKTWSTWLADLEWAKQEVDIQKTACRNQDSVADPVDQQDPPSQSPDQRETPDPPRHSLDPPDPPSQSPDQLDPPSQSSDQLESQDPPSHSLDPPDPPRQYSDQLESQDPPSHSLHPPDPPRQYSDQLDSQDPPSHSLDPPDPPRHQLDSQDPPSHSLDPPDPPRQYSDQLDSQDPPSHSLDPPDPPRQYSDQLESQDPPSHSLDPPDPPRQYSDQLESQDPPSHSLHPPDPPRQYSDQLDSQDPPSHSLDPPDPPRQYSDQLDSQDPPSHSLDSQDQPSHSLDPTDPPSQSPDQLDPTDPPSPSSDQLDSQDPPSQSPDQLDTPDPPSQSPDQLDPPDPPSHSLDPPDPPSQSPDQLDPPDPPSQSPDQLDSQDPPSQSPDQLDPPDPPSQSPDQLDPPDPPSQSRDQLDSQDPPSHSLDPTDQPSPSSDQLDSQDPPSQSPDQLDPPDPPSQSRDQLDPPDPPSQSPDQLDPPDPPSQSSDQLDPPDPPSQSSDQLDPPDTLMSSDEEYEVESDSSSTDTFSTDSEVIPNQDQSFPFDNSKDKSCCHEDAHYDEDSIERDDKNEGIFIRKVMTTQTTQTGKKKSSSRVWNNYHCCFVCHKMSTNIVKHMLTHRDVEEITNLKLLRDSTTKEGQKLSQTTQALLRNRGDHEHNLIVKRKGKGEMIVGRRTDNFHLKDYGPCPYCLEWLKLDSLGGKHHTYCPGMKTNEKLKKTEAMVRSSILTGGINDTATTRLVNEVYPVMTRDTITVTAKEDGLVIALGNNWLKRNLGNKLKRKYYTSSRMRGASRLLTHLRSITKTNKTMSDYITPEHFDSMCQAALMCAEMENNEEDLKNPSTAIKISYDVNRMANIKLGLALRNGNTQWKKEAEDFLSLLKLEWSTKVTRMARLNLRRNQISQPCKQLPLPEDLSVLGGRVVDELKKLDTQENTNFRRAQILVQTRLLTYNKRRSGELEALSLENYENRSKGLDDADQGLVGSELTDLERYLVSSQELIKIRGKNGKIVPILVPGDSVDALRFICSPSVRESAGIKRWNCYVFANTGDGVVRAYDSLKEICGELNLAAPERITSVTMRKYIATISQVIDMKDHELEWLCNHLGHTVQIHKLHYRSTSGFIERVNIGKLMLLQDLNLAGKYAGKRLQDIDLSEVVTNPPRALPDTVDAGDVSHSDTDPEFVEDVGEDGRPPQKKMRKSSTRVAWSTEEEQELKDLLGENLRRRRIPRMSECLKAIGQSRKNKGVLHQRKWETIKKKALRMIDQLKKVT